MTEQSGASVIPEFQPIQGPFVAFCVICETVIEDKTNTLSLVRIIERWTTSDQPPFPVRFWIAIGLRNLPIMEENRSAILYMFKEEDRTGVMSADVVIEEEGESVNLIVQTPVIGIPTYGFYRLSVVSGGQELAFTRLEFVGVPPISESYEEG